MNSSGAKTALICIDLQEGFLDESAWGGARNNPNAERLCAKIITKFRAYSLPILHVRHSSSNPASPLHASSKGFAFQPACAPFADETIITKSVNSAFIGTELNAHLRANNYKRLVFIGLTTDHCVSTSVRMAGNFGYETYVISDATATFAKTGLDGTAYSAELIHNTALASLNGEFATVLTSSELFVQQWSRTYIDQRVKYPSLCPL